MNITRALLFSLILGITGSGNVLADDLGKLFTTAAERARIDAQRSGRAIQEDTPGNAVSSERVVVNGTLRGSDGKRLVWLNGVPVSPARNKDLALLRNGNVQLSLQDGTRTLKPGQGIDQVSGQIFEYNTPVAVVPPAAATDKETPAAAANPGTTAPVSPAAADAQGAGREATKGE